MTAAFILNIVNIILEITGLAQSVPRRKGRVFAFYTQNSNIAALVSSVLFVIFIGRPEALRWVSQVRYLSSCMLAMTFIVVMTILIPGGGGVKAMLFQGNVLQHHLLCPVVSVVSYLFFEPVPAREMIWLPVVVTLCYGIIMMFINHLEKYDGPYPFFRVNHQSKKATFLWTLALFAMILLISWLVSLR